jgi:hypothetical protein
MASGGRRGVSTIYTCIHFIKRNVNFTLDSMRICTRCQAQVEYIEEGIEDDELERYRTRRGRLLHRKTRRHRKTLTYAALPDEADVLSAFRSILLQGADGIQALHGFPPTFRQVTDSLWSRYQHVLNARLPFSVLHFFLIRAPRRAAASIPKELHPGASSFDEYDEALSGEENAQEAMEASTMAVDAPHKVETLGVAEFDIVEAEMSLAPAPSLDDSIPANDSCQATSSSSRSSALSEMVRQDRARFIQRRQALDTARRALACEDSPSEDELIPPSMRLVLAILLAAARSLNLPLLSADLIRAARDGVVPYFTAHAMIQPSSLREYLQLAHGSALVFFRPKVIPTPDGVLVLAERFVRQLYRARAQSTGDAGRTAMSPYEGLASHAADVADVAAYREGERSSEGPGESGSNDAAEGLQPFLDATEALACLARALRLPPEAAVIAARFVGPTTEASVPAASLLLPLEPPPRVTHLIDRIWCEVELGALLVLGCRLCPGWEKWEYGPPRFARPSAIGRTECFPWTLAEARGLQRSDLAAYLAMTRTALRRTSIAHHVMPPDESGIWTEEIGFLEQDAAAAAEADAALFSADRYAPMPHADALNSQGMARGGPPSAKLADCAEGVPLPSSGSFDGDVRCLVTYPLAAAFDFARIIPHYRFVDPDAPLSDIVYARKTLAPLAFAEGAAVAGRKLNVGDRVVMHGLPASHCHLDGCFAEVLSTPDDSSLVGSKRARSSEERCAPDSCVEPGAQGICLRVDARSIPSIDAAASASAFDIVVADKHVLFWDEELRQARHWAKNKVSLLCDQLLK